MHTHTHTHTSNLSHFHPPFFFSSIILFWKNRSSCFVSLRATSALQLSCVRPVPTLRYLKTFVWPSRGPRADFGRQTGADRDKLHNAEWTVCQEANGSLKKNPEEQSVCERQFWWVCQWKMLCVVLQKTDELIWEGSFLSGHQSQVKTRIMKRYRPWGLLLLCINSVDWVISALELWL